METADRKDEGPPGARMFRNWRQLLARSSAEFAIVVLGVTMALWADGCVSERSDRVEEEARLYGLRDNVGETLEEIRAERENAAGAIQAFRQLFDANGVAPDRAELPGLVRYVLFYGSAFSPELNVYEDLKNSGELALLTSASLRQALARMDVRVRRVEFAQSDLLTVQQLNVDSYMMEHLDMQFLMGADMGLMADTAESEFDVEFLDDREFRNRMMMKLDLVLQLEAAMGKAEAALVAVRDEVDAQLPE